MGQQEHLPFGMLHMVGVDLESLSCEGDGSLCVLKKKPDEFMEGKSTEDYSVEPQPGLEV